MRARAATATRWAGGKIPLLALSLYGVADGDASQGLEVSRAACWVDARDGTLRMQMIGSSEVDADAPAVPEFAGQDGRRWSGLSLCPDQNSRRIIAYSEGGQITVSRLVPDGPSLAERRDTWAGEDCRLGFDAWLLDAANGEQTDVIAFYLSSDRLKLCYRVQRENFAIEHIYQTLEQPCSLDVVARAANSLSVWVSPRGAPAVSVISDPYPARARDGVRLDVALVGAEYFELIVVRDPVAEGLSYAVTLQGVTHGETIVQRDTTLEGLGFSLVLQGAAYAQTIISSDSYLEGLSLAVALQGATYTNTVIDGGAYGEGLSYAVALVGVSYV